MESSKLLRSQRSSDNRKKRKKKEKAENAKRRKSQNVRKAEKAGEASKVRFENTCHEESPTQQAGFQEDIRRHKKDTKSEELSSRNEAAERYHRHALFFFSQWKKAEQGNLSVIEKSSVKDLQIEIGRGCYGVCSLAKYGAWTVVVKKQHDYALSREEATMISKLSHPNIVRLIGILEMENRIDIVTHYYNLNGNHINLCDVTAETEDINWYHLLKGLCNGIRYLHDRIKVLHNDIKSNNVVLDGCSMAEAEAVLVDFGKAAELKNPKVYQTPADTRKAK